MDIEKYKWDNNCILVGTLFGGKGDVVSVVSDLTVKILEEEMLENGMVNNEQIALLFFYLASLDIQRHLEIFKKQCRFS